jgi:glycosyltransferase involved in cell wall biosynthesis
MRGGVLALSWFEHRRMRGLCTGLGLELVVLSSAARGARRYLLLSARTLGLLLRRRPAVLVVQNPSLVLAALSLAARWLFGYRLVVDAHNEAVTPFVNRQRTLVAVSRWVLRRADLTLVTNAQLADIVRARGGTAFVLPDRIPAAPAAAARTLRDRFNVVLIATFAPDEPVGAIFEAVSGLDVDLYVTGNNRRLAPAFAAAVPGNVVFTGFLAEADYWGLLRSADAILDLTSMPDCLVCGAYEALAVGKPMVLSGNQASRELFGAAAVFTDNSPGDIRRALQQVRQGRAQLQSAGEQRREELESAWAREAGALTGTLASWQRAPAGARGAQP